MQKITLSFCLYLAIYFLLFFPICQTLWAKQTQFKEGPPPLHISLTGNYLIPQERTKTSLQKSHGVSIEYTYAWLEKWITGYSLSFYPIKTIKSYPPYDELKDLQLFKLSINQKINIYSHRYFRFQPGFSLSLFACYEDKRVGIGRHAYFRHEPGFSIFHEWAFIPTPGIEIVNNVSLMSGFKTAEFKFLAMSLGVSLDF